jgi:luciferase family oxidoreductase group 1
MHTGEPASSAIARSVDLAQHAERLGYTRFWLAEHHSIEGLACSATSVLIGHVAAATKTIRVGIDLGLGRAPGGDFQTMRALRRDLRQTGEEFPQLLEELRTYLGPTKPGQTVKAIPGQGSNVPITLLGSSGFSAQLAGRLGLPFAFAAHFAPEYLYTASRLYRVSFRPGDVLHRPYLMVAVPVIAAETDAAARRLFTTPQQRFLRLIRNQPVELLPPVDSIEELWQDFERTAVETRLSAAIVGSSATVKAGLEKLVSETAADEVIVVTDTYDHADRLRSYERVAAAAKELGVAA